MYFLVAIEACTKNLRIRREIAIILNATTTYEQTSLWFLSD